MSALTVVDCRTQAISRRDCAGDTRARADPVSRDQPSNRGQQAGLPGAVFDFTGRQRPERYWLLIEHADAEICKTYPGFNEDLYITAEAEAFAKWHAGQLTWAAATRSGRIQLHGPTSLVRAFPTWNARSMFAHVKPVPRSAVSSAG